MKSMEMESGQLPPDETAAIVARSPVMVIRWRMEAGWPVEFCSGNILRLGYTSDDLVSGRVSWTGIIHPEDVPRLEQEVRSFLAGGAEEFVQEYRLVSASGESVWVEDRNTVLRDDAGEMTHVQGVIMDITRAKRAEKELRDAQSRLEALLDATMESACLLTPEGIVLVANTVALNRSGFAPSEVLGKNIFDLVPPNIRETRRSLFHQVIRSGHSGEIEDVRHGRVVRSRLTPVFDSHGQVTEVALFARDMTVEVQAIEALERRNAEMQELAHTDELTGLSNRRCFMRQLSSEVARLERYGGVSSLAIVDADMFKQLNDTRGHLAGDQFLQELASLLSRHARTSDAVARLGGDEFVVLMPNTPADKAGILLDRVRAELKTCSTLADGADAPATFSAGIADTSTLTDWTGDAWLALADQGLYKAKELGRDRNCVFPD
jgi:diguanylate cyclase (GGDEF)-like protein/PAS domain S-box-containing protein